MTGRYENEEMSAAIKATLAKMRAWLVYWAKLGTAQLATGQISMNGVDRRGHRILSDT